MLLCGYASLPILYGSGHSHARQSVALVSSNARSADTQRSESLRQDAALADGPEERHTLLVLASGGVDSSTLLWLSVQEGLTPTALFVDYGQPAAEAEGAAVEVICSRLRIPWRSVRYKGSRFGVGEIRGRNALLMHMALVEFPSNSGAVGLGIHAGTDYADCSPEFMEAIERSYEFHTGGAISATAPFLHWTKQEVYRLATELGIPFAQTHSCEASNLPCGQCRSCQDRSLLVTGPFAC